MPFFKIKTLGCKVNQSESESIARRLEAAGWQPAIPSQAADVCIVNTCTVTQKASMQSRQAIRQALRANPAAEVIVTGCYAQTAPEEIRRIDGVHKVVGRDDKLVLADTILKRAPQPVENEPARSAKLQAGQVPSIPRRARARPFFKIQDGCNAFCSYCIVPHARGRSRSLPPAAVLEGISRLTSEGYPEVVLTGIHLGSYGQDLTPQTDLVHLLQRIRQSGCIERVRLSSIEPLELSQTLIDFMAASRTGPGRVCPHLHVPLQSGDDDILKRMQRPYSRQYFRDLVQEIRRRLPDAAIGVDVLVGFPGESPTAFERTCDLIAGLPVTYLHVFPFSARRGTPAWHYPDKVADAEIRSRCRKLREVGLDKKTIFYNNYINRKLEVLVETVSSPTGTATGTSANYIPVDLSAADSLPSEHTLIWVRGQALTPDLRLSGRMIPAPGRPIRC